MRLPEEPDLPPRIDIVPAIDVIFAILAFFIVSSLFLAPSEGIRVNLPSAETTEVQPPQAMTVTIEATGTLQFEGKEIALDDLEAVVRSQVKDRGDTLIAINADEAVNHGLVVAVMDRLRALPGVRFGFRTQRPQPGEGASP